MKSVCKKTLLVASCLLSLSLQAKNYICMPAYQYDGWKDKKTIKLSSVYYKGYGQTKTEAQQEALFLCNLVYKHCTAPEDYCRPYRHDVVWCWDRNQQTHAFHHNKDTAMWLVKNMCKRNIHEHSDYLGETCKVEGCRVVDTKTRLIQPHSSEGVGTEGNSNSSHDMSQFY